MFRPEPDRTRRGLVLTTTQNNHQKAVHALLVDETAAARSLPNWSGADRPCRAGSAAQRLRERAHEVLPHDACDIVVAEAAPSQRRGRYCRSRPTTRSRPHVHGRRGSSARRSRSSRHSCPLAPATPNFVPAVPRNVRKGAPNETTEIIRSWSAATRRRRPPEVAQPEHLTEAPAPSRCPDAPSLSARTV
jgi:hypothetical protein